MWSTDVDVDVDDVDDDNDDDGRPEKNIYIWIRKNFSNLSFKISGYFAHWQQQQLLEQRRQQQQRNKLFAFIPFSLNQCTFRMSVYPLFKAYHPNFKTKRQKKKAIIMHD